MKTPKTTKPVDVQGLIRARANQMTWRWFPVQRKADDPTPVTTNLARSLVEELLFYPSKVFTLVGVFATKAKVNPGFFTGLYMLIVGMVTVLPLILVQAILWQAYRALKAIFKVCTGTLSYAVKPTTKNK